MNSLVVLAVLASLAVAYADRPSVCKQIQLDSWSWAYAQRPVPNSAWITSMSVVRQDSGSDGQCKFDDSYGFKTNRIWVNRGCRALFNVCYVQGKCQKLNLSSWSWKYTNMTLEAASAVYSMSIASIQSWPGAPCVQDYSYGFIANYLYVDFGCRADFNICYV